jgi:hypothetical protein
MFDCVRASDDNLPLPADVDGVSAASESEQGDEITRYDDLAISPTWTFRGGTVAFHRQSDPNRMLARIGPVVVNAADFAFPLCGGPDLDLVRHSEIADVEFRYFAVDDFSASVGPATLPTYGPFGPFPLGTVFFSGNSIFYLSASKTLSASEYSQLRSFELNFRKDVSPALTVLAGYRHIDLNERIFGQFSYSGINTDSFSIQGFNRMDGFQLGGEAVLWRPGAGRFRLEGSAKAGVFGDATSNFGNFDNLRATASGGHVALASEWSVTAAYQITPHLAARFGYEGLLLDGVALASEQVGVLNPHAGTGTVENSGTPIYQGMVANLEYAW